MGDPEDTKDAPVVASVAAAKVEDEGEDVNPGTFLCSNCDDDCWKVGWLMLAEEEGGTRNYHCDSCLLFCKKPKGAERIRKGKVIPAAPKKPKKPKAAKKKGPASKFKASSSQ